MNVVSTASVLLQTPSDVNGFISIVFVGSGTLNPADLGPAFRVQKKKVWLFLVWLKNHNRLYADIPLDPDVMALYPDDDMLPGLSS